MNALLTDPTMHLFALCAAVLVIKMLLTSNITGALRTTHRVYAAPEDYKLFGVEPVTAPDAQIERVRRAHQNDLENILPFFASGFLYALTGPSYRVAWWLFVSFTISRLAHTAVYMAGLQPWRTILFGVGNIALYVMTLTLLVRLL